MKINVEAINEITTHYEMNKPPSFFINVHLKEHQIEYLFYQIWEEIGEDGINEIVKKEGFKFVTNNN